MHAIHLQAALQCDRCMHHEIISNLHDNYYGVQLDPEMRPTRGFLIKDICNRNFEKACFSNVDSITELDRYDQIGFFVKPLHSFMVLRGKDKAWQNSPLHAGWNYFPMIL